MGRQTSVFLWDLSCLWCPQITRGDLENGFAIVNRRREGMWTQPGPTSQRPASSPAPSARDPARPCPNLPLHALLGGSPGHFLASLLPPSLPPGGPSLCLAKSSPAKAPSPSKRSPLLDMSLRPLLVYPQLHPPRLTAAQSGCHPETFWPRWGDGGVREGVPGR